jgi:phytoene dehydrogenase-like protein
LVSYLESLGGVVRCGARVVSVTSAGGRVTGVEVEDGEAVAAPLVIADVMPHALAALGGDALSRWYRALIKRYVYGPGTLKLDWALDGPIPWTNSDVRGAGTVHVGGGEDELLETIEASADRLPEKPFLLLGQQSIADPTRAPAGKHTAWAYTHGPADAAGWDAHAERVEAQVERYAPGFRDLVLARHVLSPSDLQARNANLVGGDVGGGSYMLRQVIFRPIPTLSPYRTPLKGLFLGSAAAFPGGAVHGVPGDAAAAAALRRWP